MSSQAYALTPDAPAPTCRADQILDVLAPFVASRWIFTLGLFVVFMAQVVLDQGLQGFVVFYILALYLQCGLDEYRKGTEACPEELVSEELESGGGPTLFPVPAASRSASPTPDYADVSETTAKPPAIDKRRILERRYWVSATRATLLAFPLTFFDVVDIHSHWMNSVAFVVCLFVSKVVWPFLKRGLGR
ncbi:hypothetical protein C8Q80DRAFT_1150111 [Daedaleopsis nitida]|nr:hypothetical protein C8Q80DRAFT_1150111 [Daedaleopsis nitida]